MKNPLLELFARPPPPPPPPPPTLYDGAMEAIDYLRTVDVDPIALLRVVATSMAMLAAFAWVVESYSRGTISVGKSWRARLQTLAVASFSLYSLFPLMFLAIAITTFCLVWSRYTAAPMLLYLVWVYAVDKSATTGKRAVPWLRAARWWQHYADFFPLSLVKTAHLDPSARYVFGYHPHGIISVGAMGAFAFDGAQCVDLSPPSASGGTHLAADASPPRGFSSLFPGLDPRLVTLPINFVMPLLRELILSIGCVHSTAHTFRAVLRRGPGSAIVVVVGGAEESLRVVEHGTHPRLTLRPASPASPVP
jgi:2-acylglycerol O-acyltransferase 2